MNLGAFAVVTLMARGGDRRTDFEDYNGIGFRAPALSLTLSLFMLSLLGVPLTAGFMGKVMVFSEALDRGLYWLVVIGVLNTAISTYYYLRLIVVMYFRERTSEWAPPLHPGQRRPRPRHHGRGRALPRHLPRPRPRRLPRRAVHRRHATELKGKRSKGEEAKGETSKSLVSPFSSPSPPFSSFLPSPPSPAVC